MDQSLQPTANVPLTGVISNPKMLMDNASLIAEQFNKIVEKQKLYTQVGNSRHVHVDGWNMLGVLLGLFPSVISCDRLPSGEKLKISLIEFSTKYGLKQKWILTEKVKSEKVIREGEREEIKYEAVVTIKTLSGHEITRVRTICSNREDGKIDNDEYAIQSMAETRGAGKAFRMAFSWIVKMAGYDATPFEEMDNISYQEPEQPPASLDVMNSLEEEIEKATNEAEYKAAVEKVSRYGKVLNREDQKIIREFAANKKRELLKKKSKDNSSDSPLDSKPNELSEEKKGDLNNLNAALSPAKKSKQQTSITPESNDASRAN